MIATKRSTDLERTAAYLREAFGWSALWLFVICYVITIWRLGLWLAG